ERKRENKPARVGHFQSSREGVVFRGHGQVRRNWRSTARTGFAKTCSMHSKDFSRRSFLAASTLAALGTATATGAAAAEQADAGANGGSLAKSKPKLAISTYSYWHFRTQR